MFIPIRLLVFLSIVGMLLIGLEARALKLPLVGEVKLNNRSLSTEGINNELAESSFGPVAPADDQAGLSPAELKTVEEAIHQLEVGGAAEQALGVGDRIPYFKLPAADGHQVSITELLTQGPVVINFYRGNWCPYCRAELDAFEAAIDEFQAHDATVLAISPQDLPHTKLTKIAHNLDYLVLSDAGNRVAKAFGLSFVVPPAVDEVYVAHDIDLHAINATEIEELPIPATYLVDTDAVIRYAFIDPDYRQRATPEQVLAALDALN